MGARWRAVGFERTPAGTKTWGFVGVLGGTSVAKRRLPLSLFARQEADYGMETLVGNRCLSAIAVPPAHVCPDTRTQVTAADTRSHPHEPRCSPDGPRRYEVSPHHREDHDLAV